MHRVLLSITWNKCAQSTLSMYCVVILSLLFVCFTLQTTSCCNSNRPLGTWTWRRHCPTVDRAHDDRSVFIDDADLLSVGVPAHAPHHRLVPVVDHLLVPRTFTQGHRQEVTTTKTLQRKLACFCFFASSRHLCTASTQWWAHSGRWWSTSGTARSRWPLALHLQSVWVRHWVIFPTLTSHPNQVLFFLH